MSSKWLYLVDPGTLILISLAGLVIWYGSHLSFIVSSRQRGSSEDGKGFLQLWTVLLLPVVGSVVLVILFYFLGKLYVVLVIYISLLSLLYTTFVTSQWLSQLVSEERNRSFEVRWLGTVTVTDGIAFLLAIGIVLAWNLVPGDSTASIILTDLLAVFVALASLSFIRLPSMMLATILLVLFFFYDIFWVFLSDRIFKQSVMVSVATNMPSLPLVIIVPRLATEGQALLGLGDIVLPGVFLCFLYHVDRFKAYGRFRGYFDVAVTCYVLGLILAYVMVIATEKGQPALLYLVPAILTPTFILAKTRGDFRQLWTGRSDTPPSDEEALGQYGRLSEEDDRM